MTNKLLNWPTPLIPNSEDEWKLELRVFDAVNNSAVDDITSELLKDLWKEVCARETWFKGGEDSVQK